MGVLPKEVVREIIKENNFQTPQEIMKFLKDSFKDILQEMLEAEMDVHLGYSKGEKPPANSDNTRNGCFWYNKNRAFRNLKIPA